jgi:hypothetical protein
MPPGSMQGPPPGGRPGFGPTIWTIPSRSGPSSTWSIWSPAWSRRTPRALCHQGLDLDQDLDQCQDQVRLLTCKFTRQVPCFKPPLVLSEAGLHMHKDPHLHKDHLLVKDKQHGFRRCRHSHSLWVSLIWLILVEITILALVKNYTLVLRTLSIVDPYELVA